MSFANLRLTPSHQLVLRASDAAAAFTAARAKKPEEVEQEARARVVSEGGDPGNPMLVLGCHSIQLGKYRGQTFRWLLENDAGYACHVVASHQRERETSASDSPLMANKDSLARYSCAHPAFAQHLKFRRAQEEARARATLPGRGGEALVGIGLFKEDTLRDLYDSKEKERQTYVKWLRRKTPQPGSSMDVAIKYILGRDKERSAEAAATPPPPASSSTSSGPSTTTSQAAASTVLPPRKPTAPNFSALVRGRPMGPGELQARIRRLMNPPARPAAPAVSSVRDQRPSVPPPPTTEVTDEELVRTVTDGEMAGVQVLQALPLPLVKPPSPPPPAPSSTPPPAPPPQVAAAPPTVGLPARAPAQTRVEPRGVSVEETPCGEATLAPEPEKKRRKTTTTGDVEQPATPAPARAETRLPEGWRTALSGEEQELNSRTLSLGFTRTQREKERAVLTPGVAADGGRPPAAAAATAPGPASAAAVDRPAAAATPAVPQGRATPAAARGAAAPAAAPAVAAPVPALPAPRRLLAPRQPAPSAAYPVFPPTAAAAAATGPLRAAQPLLVDLLLPRQCVWVLPVPVLTLPRTLPAPHVLPPPLAAAQHAGPELPVALPAAQHAGELPVPLRTVQWRRLTAERRAEAGNRSSRANVGVPQAHKCSKCGQPRRRETGHSRHGREYFCSVAAGQSVEDWLREKKERDQGGAQH
ncbi:WAS/WASL-interacting protein family member 3-like [Gadus chalcogrammus]|uniref:WAS/WASL-interacting protein family member 3-like n=1 Tax=Gadus chalcogrammus TaxID=1042646 RepID=UPI0024C3D98A|nr:WAS/WASL-interacting protein family member 3-like [Gadus chalcogrammus]